MIEHSCGAAGGDDVNPEATMNPTDGSFGDPGVRIAQFVNAFPNSVPGVGLRRELRQLDDGHRHQAGPAHRPPCITGTIQKNSAGQPICSVVEHLTDSQGVKKDITLQNCAASGSNPAQCWTIKVGQMGCANGSQLTVTDTLNANPQSAYSSINCALCLAGSTVAGCP